MDLVTLTLFNTLIRPIVPSLLRFYSLDTEPHWNNSAVNMLWPSLQVLVKCLRNSPGSYTALAAINTNQFVSLLANDKLRTLSLEKCGFQTSLICHNRRAEEANLIIWLLVSDSLCVADTIWSQGGLFQEACCLLLFDAVKWIRFQNCTTANHISAQVKLWCVGVPWTTPWTYFKWWSSLKDSV